MNTATDAFTQHPAEVVRARTRALRDQLGPRGFDNEARGQIDPATVEQVLDAGIMRMGVPHRYGGLEVDYELFPEVSQTLGQACLATAWTIGILLQHNMQMGLFPEEAQDEFWANGPNTFAPGFIIPGGTAQRVSGGYRLKGHWRFGSGYPLGDWILLGAHEIVDGEKKQVRRFALPRADTQAQNNWQVSGLSASSTWDCLLDDVFVPEHRSMPASSMLDGTAPGLQINTGPTWRIPMLSFYYPNMAAMVLGAAQGVARQVLERMKGRTLAYGGAQASELAYMRANTARGPTELNAAEALLRAHASAARLVPDTGLSCSIEPPFGPTAPGSSKPPAVSPRSCAIRPAPALFSSTASCNAFIGKSASCPATRFMMRIACTMCTAKPCSGLKSPPAN